MLSTVRVYLYSVPNRNVLVNTSESIDSKRNIFGYDIYRIYRNATAENNQTTDAGQRHDMCNNCFKHDFKYLIENDDICKQRVKESKIDLLILILTAHENLRQRTALRESWLTYSKNNTGNVRHAFLLGDVDDLYERDAVSKENQKYKDIIKEDFMDSYRNLTFKTIMGFKWAVTKCGDTRFVLKTDDDMLINIPNVLKILKTHASILETSIIGSCNAKPKPNRDKTSKWFASEDVYPRKEYPGFCSGTGYLTSMNVIQKVYQISPYIPFFHLEDVYIGLCIHAIGYHVTGFPGFTPGRLKLNPCKLKDGTIVTAHHVHFTMLKRLWNSDCVHQSKRIRLSYAGKILP